jgi:hypothetical protein
MQVGSRINRIGGPNGQRRRSWTMITPFILPIVAVLGAFAVAITGMILKSHARDRQQRERMFFAEKGMEIPKELYESREPKKPNGFRAGRAWLMVLGYICVFVGIAVMISVTVNTGFHDGVFGIIPALIGVGFLVSERMIASRVARQDGQ